MKVRVGVMPKSNCTLPVANPYRKPPWPRVALAEPSTLRQRARTMICLASFVVIPVRITRKLRFAEAPDASGRGRMPPPPEQPYQPEHQQREGEDRQQQCEDSDPHDEEQGESAEGEKRDREQESDPLEEQPEQLEWQQDDSEEQGENHGQH